MKLLFDANLSFRLVAALSDIYPDSAHVSKLDPKNRSDETVFKAAKEENYLIVTKDSDFNELVIAKGHPPKVIWLQLGNCTTKKVEDVLRNTNAEIENFYAQKELGIMVIQAG